MLNLTQFDLARLSTVSLPTIQNIEAGKGNPSFETLTCLLKTLNLEIVINVRPCDWNILSMLGLPIMSGNGPKSSTKERNSKMLMHHLGPACLELKMGKNVNNYKRKKESVQATILAIKHHYPKLLERETENLKLLLEFLPKKINGRHIKLRRQALSVLSSYL